VFAGVGVGVGVGVDEGVCGRVCVGGWFGECVGGWVGGVSACVCVFGCMCVGV